MASLSAPGTQSVATITLDTVRTQAHCFRPGTGHTWHFTRSAVGRVSSMKYSSSDIANHLGLRTTDCGNISMVTASSIPECRTYAADTLLGLVDNSNHAS